MSGLTGSTMPKLCFGGFDVKLFNTILLGLCFMVLFSAELATLNMQKTIISSIHDENPNFNMEGYFLHGVTYSMYATSLWLAPSIVCLTGSRLGMILAGAGHTYYLLAFSTEREWAIYLGSVIMGLSAAVLWTAENKYLLSNSTPQTRSRNISIFWFFYSSSEFYGNLILYFQLEGKKFMDAGTRHLLIYAMGGLSCVALVMFLFLQPGEQESQPEQKQNSYETTVKAFKKTWSIFTSREMQILSFAFFYVGLSQAFTFGVYGPSVGFTLQFGNNAKQLVALSGICLGTGEMMCGGLQVMLSNSIQKHRYGRFGLMSFGFLLHLVTYVCIYLNLPNNAVFGNTYDSGYIESSVPLAMVCSLMLGLADCCLNTQVYSLLAAMHPDSGAQTCALYKFTKAVVKATSYYSSNHLGLHTHLHILVPSSVAGVVAYYVIDRKVANCHVKDSELQELNKCNT